MISGIGSFSDYSQMSSMRSRMENPFEKLDSNGDGSLDKTEISSMAEKLSEMRGESVDADQIISKLDSDGDGLVNQEEFEAGRPEGPPPGMMGGGMPGNAAQSLLDEFEEMDSDGDGLLDETEFGSMAEMLSGMTGESIEAAQIISKLDSDGDGLVSQEEFEAGRPEGPPPGMMGGGMQGSAAQSLLDEFEEMDSDEDGLLDETEFGSMAEMLSEMTGESIDAARIISKLDTDGDGLVSQEEFEAGRPEGPPPGMMGGGMPGSAAQSLVDETEDSEEDDASGSVAFLDANGDGIVDAEEAKAGINKLILEYGSLIAGTSKQVGGYGSQLNLFV